MLGANKKISKQLLVIELLTVSNLAFFIFMIFLYINHLGIINVGFVQTMLNYLKITDYILIYIILLALFYFVCLKFVKKLFKKSIMATL